MLRRLRCLFGYHKPIKWADEIGATVHLLECAACGTVFDPKDPRLHMGPPANFPRAIARHKKAEPKQEKP